MRRWPRPMTTLHGTLRNELVGRCESVLDVGCGWNSPLQVISKLIPLTVGVDAFEPSLERARLAGIHTRYQCMDLLQLSENFPPGSFDAVIALDVIEHFERADGERFLEQLETIARKKVMVFTPNGFLPQGDEENNPWQVHRSGWRVSDFHPRGYRVLGINGLKPLRGKLAVPRVRPLWLGDRLSRLTQPLVTHRPGLAFQLLAIRDLS